MTSEDVEVSDVRRKAQEDFRLGLRCLVTEDGCELEGVGSRDFLGWLFRGILMDGKKCLEWRRFSGYQNTNLDLKFRTQKNRRWHRCWWNAISHAIILKWYSMSAKGSRVWPCQCFCQQVDEIFRLALEAYTVHVRFEVQTCMNTKSDCTQSRVQNCGDCRGFIYPHSVLFAGLPHQQFETAGSSLSIPWTARSTTCGVLVSRRHWEQLPRHPDVAWQHVGFTWLATWVFFECPVRTLILRNLSKYPLFVYLVIPLSPIYKDLQN